MAARQLPPGDVARSATSASTCPAPTTGSCPTLASREQAGHTRIYAMAVELVRHSDSRIDRQQLARVRQQLPARRAADDRRALGVAEHAEAGADRKPPAAGRRDAGSRARAPARRRRLRVADRARTARRDAGRCRPALDIDLRRPAAAPAPRVRPAAVVDPHGGRGPPRVAGRRPRKRRFAASTSARRPTRCRWPTPITSLRLCSTLDWRQYFESVSLVEQVLQRDPAGAYGRMDFLSRDRQRQAVEELAAPSGDAQVRVALRAVESARQAAAADRRRIAPPTSAITSSTAAGAISRSTSPIGRDWRVASGASCSRTRRRSTSAPIAAHDRAAAGGGAALRPRTQGGSPRAIAGAACCSC